MPGLARSDDRTLVDAMQHINVAIENPVFFASFLGAPVLTLVALVIERRSREHEAARYILAGLVLSVLGFLTTMAFNIPLNNTLENAGAPGRITDVAGVRDDFLMPWVAWNIVRALATTGVLGCLIAALMLRGRSPVSGAISADEAGW